MRTYIDGKECVHETGLEAAELVLKRKLCVFGGGKEAEARGGRVSRVLVHEVQLSDEQIEQLHLKINGQNKVFQDAAHTIHGAIRCFDARWFPAFKTMAAIRWQ